MVWPLRPRFCPASPNPVPALPRSAWPLAAGSLRSSFLFLPPFPPRRALLIFLPNPHLLSKPDSTAPSSMVSENFLDKDTAVLVFSTITAARLGSQHVGMDYFESFKMKMMTIQICILIMKTPCGKDVHVLRLLPRPDPGERDGGKRCRPVSSRVPGCGPQAGWRAWSLRALSTTSVTRNVTAPGSVRLPVSGCNILSSFSAPGILRNHNDARTPPFLLSTFPETSPTRTCIPAHLGCRWHERPCLVPSPGG